MRPINLMNGDCLELMKTIPDNSVDLILTDPPYGTTACKWDSIIPFDLMWIQLKRIIKPNGAIVLFGSEPFSSLLRCSNLKYYRYDWKWEKDKGSNYVHANYQPMKNYEDIIIFSQSGSAQGTKFPMKYYPQKTKGIPYDKGVGIHTPNSLLSGGSRDNSKIILKNISGDRMPLAIQKFKSSYPVGKKLHPTQKPVELLEYLIKTYSNENETVLDFTMGSGSTGVACLNTNRNFIGIELDKDYFKIASDRIENRKNEIDTQLVF